MINIAKQKILITGASGFVGSNAARYFTKKGAYVTAIVSPDATNKIINRQLGDVKQSLIVKRLDLLSPAEALEATEQQDIILHFAAVDGNAEYKKTHSAEIFSKNIRIVLNMLEAAVKTQIKTFVLISSTDIYTPSNHRLITEDSPIDIHWDKEIDGYKLAKWSSELAAKEFSKQYNLNVIVVRPSNLYGPGDEFENGERMRVIPSIIKKIYTSKNSIILWGKKKQMRSFLYIEDFLSICRNIIEQEIYNYPINIASKHTVTLEGLADTIIKVTGKKRKFYIDRGKTAGSLSRKFNLSRLEKISNIPEETELTDGIKKTIEFYKKTYLK